MQDKDKLQYIERYTSRLNTFGYSPETLGWGKHGRQDLRFKMLSQFLLKNKGASVLDVGCGFGDLYGFLKEKGWYGTYTGVDLVPDLLKVGREKYPGIHLIEGDIVDNKNIEPHDFVIASGIFNARLEMEDNYEHIKNTLQVMFDHANIMVCSDFLSSNVDFKKEIAWHSEPEKIIGVATSISSRYMLSHDYMPFEFAVFIFKDSSKTTINTYPPIAADE